MRGHILRVAVKMNDRADRLAWGRQEPTIEFGSILAPERHIFVLESVLRWRLVNCAGGVIEILACTARRNHQADNDKQHNEWFLHVNLAFQTRVPGRRYRRKGKQRQSWQPCLPGLLHCQVRNAGPDDARDIDPVGQ